MASPVSGCSLRNMDAPTLVNAKPSGYEAPLKRCFIISPIADQTTRERAFVHWKANYLLQTIIEPVLADLGYVAERFDKMAVNGWITPEMIGCLSEWEMAVAVLEGNNPNCCYELGIRHAWMMPCVVMSPEVGPGQHDLPFDLKDVTLAMYPAFQLADDSSNGCEWTPETIQQVRGQLRARLVGAEQSDKARNLFHTGLARVSEPYGLKLIFELKREALLDLKLPLFHFNREYSHDFEMRNDPTKAGAKLLELIYPYKKIFDLHCAMLHYIVDGKLRTLRGTPSCLALCMEMASISGSIEELARRLLKKDTESLPPEEIDARLLAIISRINASITQTTT